MITQKELRQYTELTVVNKCPYLFSAPLVCTYKKRTLVQSKNEVQTHKFLSFIVSFGSFAGSCGKTQNFKLTEKNYSYLCSSSAITLLLVLPNLRKFRIYILKKNDIKKTIADFARILTNICFSHKLLPINYFKNKSFGKK